MAFTDDSLGFNLNRTNARNKNIWTQRLKQYGVTPEQCAVMFCLWEKDGVTPKGLSFEVSKDAPTTVRILEKLIKKGLVRRESDPADKRSYRIYVTPSGNALREKIRATLKDQMEIILKGIDNKELQLLMKLLKQMYANLDSEAL